MQGGLHEPGNVTSAVLGFTLMPVGTAFLFPCVSGMLSQVVSTAERGLYLGVQQSFGGVARVAFPIIDGAMMDRFGSGSPYLLAAFMVLATLPLAMGIAPRVKLAPATGD